MAEQQQVRVGQVWADNDWRAKGRTVRVEFVGSETASCRVLTNRDNAQQEIDGGSPWTKDMRQTMTRIRLDRFRPTGTGYVLVQDTTDQDDTGTGSNAASGGEAQ